MNTLTPELLQQITQAVLTTIHSQVYFLPKNSSILLWKSKTLPNAFTLKINEQRLVGLVRTDRKGENYWKFKEYQELSPDNSALSEEEKKDDGKPTNSENCNSEQTH